MSLSRRGLALASVAVVTVLCVIGVVIAAVVSGGSAPAYEVNGKQVSQRDFDDQLDEVAGAQGVNQPEQPDGTINSGIAARVMNLNILRDILRDAADARGIEVDAADRQAGRNQAEQQVNNFAQAPAGYRSLTVDLFAHANALGLTDADALNRFLTRQAAKADVYVNPRYGTWRPRQGGVCPPTGCSVTG